MVHDPVEAKRVRLPLQILAQRELLSRLRRVVQARHSQSLASVCRVLLRGILQMDHPTVTFITRRSDGFVNCTELCNGFGHTWGEYRVRPTSSAFIQALAKKLNMPCYEDLVDSSINKGTWAHKSVAIHLLHWLDPELFFSHIYQLADNQPEFIITEYTEGFVPPPLQLTDTEVVKPLALQLQNKVCKWFEHLLKTGEYDKLYRYAKLKGIAAAPPGFVTCDYLFLQFEKFCDDSRLRKLYRIGTQGFCKRLRLAGFVVPSKYK